MKTIACIANIYLFLVGLLYILTGLITATAGVNLLSPILNLLIVSPIQLIENVMNSLRCGSLFSIGECFPGALEKANHIAFGLGILAIIGGILGILGAVDIYRNKKSGYRIWQFLTFLAVLIVLWNWVYVTLTPQLWEKGNWIIAVFPTIWCLLYLLALFILHRAMFKS